MKILIDVNLSVRWVSFLKAAGFEAIHWSSVGAGNAPDTDIVRYAHENAYVIVTRDLDFGTILAVGRLIRPSVVLLRVKQSTPNLIGANVIAVLRASADDLEQGALISFDLRRTRLRILPLTERRLPED